MRPAWSFTRGTPPRTEGCRPASRGFALALLTWDSLSRSRGGWQAGTQAALITTRRRNGALGSRRDRRGGHVRRSGAAPKGAATVGRFRQFVSAWNDGPGWSPAEGSGKLGRGALRRRSEPLHKRHESTGETDFRSIARNTLRRRSDTSLVTKKFRLDDAAPFSAMRTSLTTPNRSSRKVVVVTAARPERPAATGYFSSIGMRRARRVTAGGIDRA